MIINPSETKVINVTEDSYSVLELIFRSENKKTIIQVIILLLLTIPLGIIGCLEIAEFKNKVSFPIKYDLPLSNKNYELSVFNSTEKFKCFDVYVNNEKQNTVIICTKEDKRNIIKAFYKYCCVLLAFPVIILICCLIIGIIKNQYLLFLAILMIVGIIFIVCFVKEKKSIINTINNYYIE